MNKFFKKVAAFILLAIVAVVMIPARNAFAAEKTDEKVAIYVQVPEDWEAPCLWAWNEDGTNAFDAWPGGEFEADSNNEGWYYVWIPNWANHVIVNAKGGTVQTGEQILEGKNAWITVTDTENVSISYDALTKGDIPEYVEKFAVHANVPESFGTPNIWAWSAPDGKNVYDAWPGKAMTDSGEGWFTAKVPVWVNSVIINGSDGADGTVQTKDLSIDPAEIWITVDKDGNADFSYNDPKLQGVANVKIHVIAPEDWANPCLWAWSAPDGTNVFATWPGEAFGESEDGWLTKEIPGWVNSIIVNGNEGSVQTSDISVDAGKDVWLVVNGSDDYKVTYEAPAVSNQEKETTTDAVKDKNDTKKISPAIFSIVGVAVAVIIAVVVVMVVNKKKKTA